MVFDWTCFLSAKHCESKYGGLDTRLFKNLLLKYYILCGLYKRMKLHRQLHAI